MILKKYIQTLQNIEDRSNGTNINIHIPLQGYIKGLSIALNKQISAITDNKINFAANSFMLPHITIFIGYVKNEKDYENLCNALAQFIKNFKPFALNFTKPYIKNNENYVFIDIVEKEKFIQLKKQLYQAIKPFIQKVEWDILNEPPHITIGYIEKDNEKVKRLLDIAKPNFKIKPNKINLSICGNYGTCVGILREFIKT